MKAIKLTLFLLIGSITLSFAQQKSIQKAVIKTPTVNCEECKTRIDNRLARQQGILTVKTDYRKHTVTVSWLSDRTNIENIKTYIANMGYDADDVTADPDSRKQLPKTCLHNPGDKPVRPKD